MSTTPFGDRLSDAVHRVGTPACVGIDPHLARLPGRTGADVADVRRFCLGVVQACRGRVGVVKPQSAFFEALGSAGVAVLEQTVAAARDAGLVVVLDAKRGDIGSTAEAYATAAYDRLGADAITVSPYLGPESFGPFLRPGKGVFALVRTSNPGAGAWQVGTGVAREVAAFVEDRARATSGAAGLGDVGAVVGATVPDEARSWREAMPHAWLLVPGYGAQGGTAATVAPLVRDDGLGALVVSAREVLFPRDGVDGDDFSAAVAARVERLVADLRDGLPPVR
jgi:orotidine-5'-phosphate decarboxylase